MIDLDLNKSAATAFSAGLEVMAAVEPGIAAAISGELGNQRRQLKLIASENYASPAVLLAMGNWLSDKYAEGTVGNRFYAGCEYVDKVEAIAASHAKALFSAEHNRNSVPRDPNGAWYTSGVRLGTPALTTLGLDGAEMDEVADIIVTVLRATAPLVATAKAKYTLDAQVAATSRQRCADLLAAHPLYPGIEV